MIYHSCRIIILFPTTHNHTRENLTHVGHITTTCGCRDNAHECHNVPGNSETISTMTDTLYSTFFMLVEIIYPIHTRNNGGVMDKSGLISHNLCILFYLFRLPSPPYPQNQKRSCFDYFCGTPLRLVNTKMTFICFR